MQDPIQGKQGRLEIVLPQQAPGKGKAAKTKPVFPTGPSVFYSFPASCPESKLQIILKQLAI